MKTTLPLLLLIATTLLPLTGCMTQNARTDRVERRQDRIDTRTSGRQERWKVRAEREDARADAFFDSM
jgi:hypothetical protein